MYPENNIEIIQPGDKVCLWVRIDIDSETEAGKTVGQVAEEFNTALSETNIPFGFEVYDAVRIGEIKEARDG